jgi:hypothetical protein
MAETIPDRAKIHLHVDQDATETRVLQADARHVCFPLLMSGPRLILGA